MVIGIIGENCTGKSTLAEELTKTVPAEIITGNDYLRMAKSESEAAALFQEKLKQAMSGEHVIYVISEKDQLAFLPEGSVRVLVTAGLDSIKERFKARMRDNLPKPVEQMLEKKHGMFDGEAAEFRFNSDRDDLSGICGEIRERIS